VCSELQPDQGPMLARLSDSSRLLITFFEGRKVRVLTVTSRAENGNEESMEVGSSSFEGKAPRFFLGQVAGDPMGLCSFGPAVGSL
jgi:hypothetical protein